MTTIHPPKQVETRPTPEQLKRCAPTIIEDDTLPDGPIPITIELEFDLCRKIALEAKRRQQHFLEILHDLIEENF